MKKIRFAWALALFLVAVTTTLRAQVPQIVSYQGRVAVSGTNFDGTGLFKFALVNAAGNATFWSNDGSSSIGNEPNSSVSLPVVKGLYSVLLGDTSVVGMLGIPSSVFGNADVRLRVWFNDGTSGSQLLSPDQRLGAVGYAVMAAAVQQVPDVVFMRGAYAGGTVYAKNDLVTTAASPDIYFYSLSDSNVGHTPDINPTFWIGVTLAQLKIIKKNLTLNSPGFTSLLSTHITGTNVAGGRISYTIRATDGGSQIATEEGVIQYLATANSITCNVQTTDKLHLGTVNSGCTPGFFNPGSQPGLSIFDNVSFSSAAPIVVHEVYFRIVDASTSVCRLEP